MGTSGARRAQIEQRVAATAARQHGVVTREQLLGAAVTPDGIRSWQRNGRLVVVHRGVYMLGSLVGRLRPPHHREMAAVLACGRGAAVSHGNALWLRALVAKRPGGSESAVHLVIAGARCRRPGIVAHRVRALPPEDVGLIDGIPTTTVLRTILDMAPIARPHLLEQVIARAKRLGLDREDLLNRLDRTRVRGAPVLRSLLSRDALPAFTRSKAEELFLEIVRAAELPEPEVNVRIGNREVDFHFPAHGVAVEVDGFAYHASRRSFEDDRDRDFGLGAGGVQVVRVTWRQLREKPAVVVRRLAAILTRAEVLSGGGRPVRK